MPEKSSMTEYKLVGLPMGTLEGDVWQYFKKFGVGEIMKIYVSKAKKNRKHVIRFTGVGLAEDRKLVRRVHNINGGKVTCIRQEQLVSCFL